MFFLVIKGATMARIVSKDSLSPVDEIDGKLRDLLHLIPVKD